MSAKAVTTPPWPQPLPRCAKLLSLSTHPPQEGLGLNLSIFDFMLFIRELQLDLDGSARTPHQRHPLHVTTPPSITLLPLDSDRWHSCGGCRQVEFSEPGSWSESLLCYY